MSRHRYFLLRSIQTILLIWVILTFLFFFFRLLPGDYTNIMLFRGASPEAVARFEARWGLNDPLYIQYKNYLINLLTFHSGTSLEHRVDVWQYIKMKVFNSFILVGPALTTAYIAGGVLGTIQGSNRGSLTEKYGVVAVLALGTTPIFFSGIILIIVLGGWLGWFPISGMVSPDTSLRLKDAVWWRPYLTSDFAFHYILPFTAIFLRYLYLPMLVMRTSVVEIIGQEFFYYQRVLGLQKGTRLRRLAKHASLPLITMYPGSMTRAIGGLVVLEVVFSWPGIGLALVDAVLSRDIPVVQFVFFMVAAAVIIGNLVVDILYGVIDPRVSVGE